MANKPLIITVNDPQLKKFGEEFEELRQMESNLKKNLEKQFNEGMTEIHTRKKATWDEVETILVERKVIPNKDLHLSYKEGVIYEEESDNESPVSKLADLIIGGLLKR